MIKNASAPAMSTWTTRLSTKRLAYRYRRQLALMSSRETAAEEEDASVNVTQRITP
jgi:hypothetical protein